MFSADIMAGRENSENLPTTTEAEGNATEEDAIIVINHSSIIYRSKIIVIHFSIFPFLII